MFTKKLSDDDFLMNTAPDWFIGLWLRKWFRLNVTQMKEKWGQYRVYCRFGFYALQDIFYPGWAYNQWPRWLFLLDSNYGHYITHWCLNWWVIPIQKWAYRYRYKQAIAKFPEDKLGIISGADYPEFLRGLLNVDFEASRSKSTGKEEIDSGAFPRGTKAPPSGDPQEPRSFLDYL